MTTETKERPIIFSGPMVRAILEGRKTQTRRVVKNSGGVAKNDQVVLWKCCPHGDPGDLLWVREGFMPAPMEAAPTTPRPTRWNIAYAAGGQAEVMAPADYNPMLYNYERWSPSIHMPRWASRLTLRITEVLVERVQDISILDAKAEGVEPLGENGDLCRWRQSFRHLWDSINAKRGHGWDTNPWVWVIQFERVTNPTTPTGETEC